MRMLTPEEEATIGRRMAEMAGPVKKRKETVGDTRSYCIVCTGMTATSYDKWCSPKCEEEQNRRRLEFVAVRKAQSIALDDIRLKFNASPTTVLGYEKGTVLQPKWSVANVLSWMKRQPRPVKEGYQSMRDAFTIERKRAEVSQQEVADHFGVSKTAITDFERGDVENPSSWSPKDAVAWMRGTV